MKLEITKDKVLEAAEKCSTAKETLKVLFPEAFDEIAFSIGQRKRFKTEDGVNLEIFTSKNSGMSDHLCLDVNYEWELVDWAGCQYVKPKKK